MTINRYKLPVIGDQQTRTFFAFFPVTTIEWHTGKRETRWMERVSVLYQYRPNYGGYTLNFWNAEKFLPLQAK